MKNEKQYFSIERLNRIRDFNKTNKIFRSGSIRGCRLCFLTYVENKTGSLGVCSLCAAKAVRNSQDEPKPLPMRF